MAKVVGPLHSSEARGGVGSLTYNTWRGIATVKTRSGPAVTMSQKQQDLRALTALATASWQALTDADRALWTFYANEHPDIDWTGNPQRITAYNWYVRVNVRIQLLGLPIVETPPEHSVDYILQSLDFYSDAGTTFITWVAHANPYGGDFQLEFYGTAPHSPGANPTIKQAKRLLTYNQLDELDEWPGNPTGTLTLFARGFDINGMVGLWTHLKKTI